MKSNLLKMFIEQLSSNPEREAYQFLSDPSSPQILTYGELIGKSEQIALELGLTETPKRALLIFNPGFDFIESLFGCFMSNTSAIPVAIPKPRTSELFAHFIHHAQPHFLLTTSDLSVRIRKELPDNTRDLTLIEVDKLIERQGDFTLPEIVNDIALIQYTSGSTSHPKGVTIGFDNLHHNLKAIKDHFELTESSVCFSWLPHYHDMGLVDGLLTPLYNKCKGIITSPLTVVSNPLNWLKAIEHYKVTHTGGPNFILDLCVSKISKSEAESLDLRSLSHVYVSAEPVRKDTLENFANHFKEAGFTSNLFTPGYGLAEATLMVTCKALKKPITYLSGKGDAKGNIYTGLGMTIPGIALKIIDPVTQEEQGEDVSGEIILHGPTITKGYYNNPESTQHGFVKIEEKGQSCSYLRTGDIGFLHDGELFITGRIKDTLIIRGVQYQAEDLEYALSNCHPDISPSGTVAFGIELENEEKVVVLIELKRTARGKDAGETIKNKVRSTLFSFFGLSIHEVILVHPGHIPKTTSGKVKRSTCRDHYLNGLFNEKP